MNPKVNTLGVKAELPEIASVTLCTDSWKRSTNLNM
jgi:hypothetical protein